MKTKQIKIIAVIFATTILLLSCKSNQKLLGPANLTLLIVDQENRAVCDYEITLYQTKKSETKQLLSDTTNKNGFCVFYDLPFAEYEISGSRSGYTIIPLTKLVFDDSSELYCYKVCDADSVLSQSKHFYQTEQIKKSLDLLESLCTENHALLSATVSFYKAYGYAKLNQKEKAGFELQQLKEFENPAFETSRYSEVIEKMILENQND